VLYKWDFVHANVVYLLRLADRVRAGRAGHALCDHVQVIGDTLLVHTDLDAPRGRLCVAPTPDRADRVADAHPQGPDTSRPSRGVGGRLYAVYSRVVPTTALVGERTSSQARIAGETRPTSALPSRRSLEVRGRRSQEIGRARGTARF
jgi:hypothetical protein